MMKYLLSVAVIAFLTAGTVSAQHVNIGIKGGLNFYNIHNDRGASNDTKIGFHAGLLGHIHLARQVAFQPELVFSMQGAKNAAGGVNTKLNLGYINVPLLLQYMFDNGFRLQAGPQIGFLISAKSSVGDSNTDVKSSLETVEFGLGAGMGYVNPATGLGVDFRYNFGLSNINKDDVITSTNRGVQIGLFYLFDHK